jgi:hypothetical protein
MSKIIPALIICFVVVVCGYIVFFPPCTAEDQVVHTFVVNRPYKEVIRVLAKQDTMESIVAMSDGRIVEKQWFNLALDIDRIIRPAWQVNGSARYVVEFSNPGCGRILLELFQELHVDQTHMDSSMRLMRPSGGVELYNNFMLVEAEGEKTKFTLTNQIIMTKRIPTPYHDYMKNQVHENNVMGAQNAEFCIQKVCQRSGLFSIPIK